MTLTSSFAVELEKIAAQTRATWTPSGKVPRTERRQSWEGPKGSTMWSEATGEAAETATRRGIPDVRTVARGAAKNIGTNPIAALVGGLTAAGLMTMAQRRDARQDKLLRGLQAIEKGEHSRRQRNRLVKTVAIAGLTAGLSGAVAPIVYRKATKAGSQLLDDITKKTRDALTEDIETGVQAGVWTSPESVRRQSDFGDEFAGKIEEAVRGIEPGVLRAVGAGMYGPESARWGLGKVLKGPPLSKEYFRRHGIPTE